MFPRHQRGEIPNPSGGVEAIITHLISKLFRLPVAHAPLPYYAGLKSKAADDPRAGRADLHPALLQHPKGYDPPRMASRSPSDATDLITVDNVGAVVVPASCLGGIPVLAAEMNSIPVITVRENRTVLDVTNDHAPKQCGHGQTYLEAAGVLVALREGIALNSLRRPVVGARRVPVPKSLRSDAIAAPTERTGRLARGR